MNRSILFGIVAVAMLVMVWLKFNATIEIAPLPDSKVEFTKVIDGVTYKVDVGGQLYRVTSDDQWTFVESVLQSAKMKAAFQQEGEEVYRVDGDDGRRFRTTRNLTEDFENVATGIEGLRELIGPQRGWGSFTLQSPKAPMADDYVALRQQILNNKADFRDASVTPDTNRAHRGKGSLKCVAPARYRGMITCKSSLTSPLLYFKQGDHFWYRASYFIEDALPTTIMDLECPWFSQQGGIRLAIGESGHLMAELKAFNKPKYRQPDNTAIVFPLGQWVEVMAHYHLSDTDDGLVQIWQDGRLIVDTKGVTLPLPSVIYSSLEVGISGHSYGNETSTLWIDDIQISDQPL